MIQALFELELKGDPVDFLLNIYCRGKKTYIRIMNDYEYIMELYPVRNDPKRRVYGLLGKEHRKFDGLSTPNSGIYTTNSIITYAFKEDKLGNTPLKLCLCEKDPTGCLLVDEVIEEFNDELLFQIMRDMANESSLKWEIYDGRIVCIYERGKRECKIEINHNNMNTPDVMSRMHTRIPTVTRTIAGIMRFIGGNDMSISSIYLSTTINLGKEAEPWEDIDYNNGTTKVGTIVDDNENYIQDNEYIFDDEDEDW